MDKGFIPEASSGVPDARIDGAPRYTPGPWRITTCMDYWVQAGDVGVALCGDIDWLGEGGNCVNDQNEMQANARLIAAAPDLLAACQGMIEAYWRGSEDSSDARAPTAVKAALAAIAKADGAPTRLRAKTGNSGMNPK